MDKDIVYIIYQAEINTRNTADASIPLQIHIFSDFILVIPRCIYE